MPFLCCRALNCRLGRNGCQSFAYPRAQLEARNATCFSTISTVVSLPRSLALRRKPERGLCIYMYISATNPDLRLSHIVHFCMTWRRPRKPLEHCDGVDSSNNLYPLRWRLWTTMGFPLRRIFCWKLRPGLRPHLIRYRTVQQKRMKTLRYFQALILPVAVCPSLPRAWPHLICLTNKNQITLLRYNLAILNFYSCSATLKKINILNWFTGSDYDYAHHNLLAERIRNGSDRRITGNDWQYIWMR